MSPIYLGWYLYVLGTAYRLLGQNASAIRTLREGTKRNPEMLSMHVGLASTLGELGRVNNAGPSVSEILKLDPDFSIKKYIRGLSYKDQRMRHASKMGCEKQDCPNDGPRTLMRLVLSARGTSRDQPQ